ncbi:MAG TPA: beta-propeller fold lactonase family protein [Bryobacteraceae bacterium]|nr:beta-propeller fold lactonase family protein [Bryobacteraceae bacterium]
MKLTALAVMVAGWLAVTAQTPEDTLRTGWKLQPAGRQIALDTFPMSTAASKDGKYLLVLHGGVNPPSVAVFETAGMKEVGRTPVADAWLGLTFSPDGRSVYVGGGASANVFAFSFAEGRLSPARTLPVIPEEKRTPNDFIGDVKLSPDGRMLFAASLYDNAVYVINLQSGRVIERFPTGRRPYRILFHPDGKSYFVSSWADGSVYHHNALNGERLGVVRLGQHTTDMVWRARKPEEKTEEQARWAGRLFVTASNTNTVFAVGVSESKDLQRIEAINVGMTPIHPAGMTPSALALSVDESRMYAVCSDANVVAVIDLTQSPSSLEGFVPVGRYPTAAKVLPDGSLVVMNGKGGSASLIESFDEPMLARYTRTAVGNSPYRDELMDRVAIPAGNPIPFTPGDPSPIQHVVYIVRESSEPHDKLASEFVRLDSFFPIGESRAEGFNWATAAIASDYVQKLSPSTNAGRRKKYDYEGGEVAALPPAGYLWSNAVSAGLAVRTYGFPDPSLVKIAGTNFLTDLAQFEQGGTMPRLTMIRLANDADATLDPLVEAISKGKFWPTTAIFVATAFAASGPAPAYILSPYTRRNGAADANIYNTASVLRTMELILGMRPLTVFDAAARPMWSAFSPKPDVRPYSAGSNNR